MRETFDIQGMTCAACSARVQKAAAAVAGVSVAEVNLLKNSMELDYDGTDATASAVCEAIGRAGYGATRRTAPAAAARKAASAPGDAAAKAAHERLVQLVVSLAFSVPLFYIAMGPMLGWPEIPGLDGMGNMMASALTQLLLCAPILFVNRRYFIVGFRTLWHRSPNMDSLIALGSAASFVYSLVALYRMAWAFGAKDMAAAHEAAHGLYLDSAGMILALIDLGKYFEARAKGRTVDAISALMDLAPKTARVLRAGVETEVAVEDVRVGDRVVVRAGESVPVDGVVLEGEAAVDESAITGEPVPVQKAAGDHVTGATTTTGGWICVEATAVGDDTTLAGIIRLVDEATSTKAPIERVADRIAGVFVPVVMGIAAVTFVAWMAVAGDFASALNHCISVLVISCPCALGLATPTAIMVGCGRGAANGILIKSAESLEGACAVDYVVMDKTGTVTAGKPSVTDIVLADGTSEQGLLAMAAVLEQKSEHPLAQAVLEYAAKKGVAAAPAAAEGFTQVAGGGLLATLGGDEALAGNARLMAERGVELGGLSDRADALAAEGKTPLFFACAGRVLGLIAVADPVKPTSAVAVERLRAMGVRTLLLTGDQRLTAEAVARKVGVDEVVAGVLPDQKELKVRELQWAGHKVAMVGDGINDAPALTRADIGIAIGAGTDVAIDAADVVLMKSQLSDVPAAIRLSRATLRNIHENLFWAFFYNVIGIPLAAGVWIPIFGWTLNPMFGSAAMSLSSFCVVSNALRLNLFKLHDAGKDKKIKKKHHKEETTMEKTMKIEGMMCGHCEAAVKKALEAVDGVASAEVCHISGTAVVTLSKPVDSAVLKKAVEDKDYKVTSIEG